MVALFHFTSLLRSSSSLFVWFKLDLRPLSLPHSMKRKLKALDVSVDFGLGGLTTVLNLGPVLWSRALFCAERNH
jgi:hypothetical protein